MTIADTKLNNAILSSKCFILTDDVKYSGSEAVYIFILSTNQK
jgi:hypothetical protein